MQNGIDLSKPIKNPKEAIEIVRATGVYEVVRIGKESQFKAVNSIMPLDYQIHTKRVWIEVICIHSNIHSFSLSFSWR